MKKNYIQNILTVLFLGASFMLHAQNISINTTGAAASASAILDLSNTKSMGMLSPQVALTNVTTLAPIPGPGPAGLIVYSTTAPAGGGGTGYYFWDGAKWNYMNVLLGASTVWNLTGNAGTNPALDYAGTSDAQPFIIKSNGIERMRFLAGGGAGIGTPVPKSSLDVNGNMSIGTYAGVNAAPANGAIISGHVGIGNNAPKSSAILDLTNTQATGGTGAPLMWCMNPNPLGNIPAPALGEEIYNTTTGCFNFYNGATWVLMGCHCVLPPPIPTITPSCPQSFQGSTITYTSSVTTGASFSWIVTSTVGVPVVTGLGTPTITVTWPSAGAGTGSVTLNLTNMCGTTTAIVPVTINATPTIAGTTPIGINSTGNVYTVSCAGATYAWSFTTNTDGSTIVGPTNAQSVTVTAGSTAGSFTLQCIITYGACSYTVTFPVTVIICSPVISPDVSGVSAATGNVVSLTTSTTNEIIMISVQGDGVTPFAGGVTVVGPGSGIVTKMGSWYPTSCCAQVTWYAYIAPNPALYTFTVNNETSYYASPWYNNFAIAFKGFCSPPTVAGNITTNGAVTDNAACASTLSIAVTTTIANSVILGGFFSADCTTGTEALVWTGAIQQNVVISIPNQTEGSIATELAAAPGPYTINCKDATTLNAALLYDAVLSPIIIHP